MCDPSPDLHVELLVWLTFRRVERGGVAKLEGCYLDGGRPIPSYLPSILDELTAGGLLALAAPGLNGVLMRRVSLTDAGQYRYKVLCKQRQPTLQMSVLTR